MDTRIEPLTDRRRARRFTIPSEHGVVRAKVRPGYEASVVDISAHGALIETAFRLLPNSRVELHLETADERAAIRGRILRCSVVSVLATRMRYHGAVHFERALSRLAAGEDAYAVAT